MRLSHLEGPEGESVSRGKWTGSVMWVCAGVFLGSCTLPQTEVMRKLADPAPICRTLEDWNVYRAAYDATPRDEQAIRQLDASRACVTVAGGTVVKEVSLGTSLEPDAIAVQLETWEQEGNDRPLSGITWRSNIVEWKFRQSGGFWKFWR